MNITKLALDGAMILEPKVYVDNRGYSGETFNSQDIEKCGIEYKFVLDYEAMNSKKNTIRGIHFQNNPHAQAKLVRVLRGEIYDVIVDLRKDSPTYKQWIGNILSASNRKQIVVPSGFGHAFVTKEDNTLVLYKFNDYYDGSLVRAIRWNDPEIGIEWNVENPVLSEADLSAPFLKDSDVNFTVEENKK